MSTLVHFISLCPLRSILSTSVYLVQFGPIHLVPFVYFCPTNAIWTILAHKVHSSPIQFIFSASIHYVYFGLFSQLQFNSIHFVHFVYFDPFGPMWPIFVHFGPIQVILFTSVHFGPLYPLLYIRSTLVRYVHFNLFNLLQFSLVPFSPIRSTLVHTVHYVYFDSFSPLWSISAHFNPFGPHFLYCYTWIKMNIMYFIEILYP